MIKYRNVNYTVDNLEILKDVNIDLQKGDFIHILGPNGGGKSTLIKLMSQMIKPTSGEITINTDKIGYLPQHFRSKKGFPATVFEVIYSGFQKQYLVPKKEQLEIIDYWLTKMDICGFKNKKIGDLSGGEQQRVFLIRALIRDPELLILDEPTSALDPNFRQVFYQMLDELYKSGMTIINITHDIDPNYLSCQHHVLYVDRAIKFDGKYCDYHQKYGEKDKHV